MEQSPTGMVKQIWITVVVYMFVNHCDDNENDSDENDDDDDDYDDGYDDGDDDGDDEI